ncbi:DUF1330 domain-containing protein [Pontibacter sp. G13]|uniref:DUF1330 domain-containing protein n=1 Tax=Pontibacter sp. G13 TaxID=3074898 RepID=UPI00288A4461|nr:DUF1330 domain-containing protein [Pontibacter sp. G13]WNJ19093.1 DUF1330 domain-containing protein [Pontibacter sp. G13]
MIYLTMAIFVQEGKEAIFHQFEDLALPLLADYNGKLIYRLRPNAESYIGGEPEMPYELHVLSFESEADFAAFAQDERRKEFLHLKEASIRSSFLVKGALVG